MLSACKSPFGLLPGTILADIPKPNFSGKLNGLFYVCTYNPNVIKITRCAHISS